MKRFHLLFILISFLVHPTDLICSHAESVTFDLALHQISEMDLSAPDKDEDFLFRSLQMQYISQW